MKTVYLNNFMSSVVTELERNGQYSTAHVCGSVLRSVMVFDGDGLLLSGITPLWLKAYEHYLLHKGEKGLEWNTISTYMRMLRAVYNRAVVRKLVPFVPHLFREVFTGRKADHRRVLEWDDMRQLLAEKDLDIISPGMEWARACLELMFRFHGMPFVDLAYLEKSNLEGNMLKYNRAKTGIPMNVEILDSAATIISQLRNKHTTVLPEHPDYLFYILSGKNKRSDEAGYKEYQSALRCFNNDLKSLARKLCIRSSVTSYTFRHSWATTAKYRGVPIEMISESLGHKSIKTTQIYLKGFELSERTKVNRLNYSYVMNFKTI